MLKTSRQIQSIHPKTHVLTIVFQPGPQKNLPSDIIRRIGAEEPSPPSQIAEISSPTSLETAVLDANGSISKGKRPNGNAWKNLTVWRFAGNIEEMMDLGFADERGGRENQGTLFYLRGCHFQDR